MGLFLFTSTQLGDALWGFKVLQGHRSWYQSKAIVTGLPWDGTYGINVCITQLVPGLPGGENCMRGRMDISFESIPVCDGRTDRRTRRPCLSRALA